MSKKKPNYAQQFQNQLQPLSYFKDKKHNPLVHGVFNKESLNLVYASAGGMKSMLMFDLAIRLANGDDFLDYPCEQSKVLYLDAEMSDADIGERLRFFNAGSPENLLYLKNGNTSFNFTDTEQQDGFIEFLENQEEPFEVVFFDNLRTMALFENENDSSQFQVINQFLIKLRDMGLAIFLVHHANRGGSEYAGSSNIITPFDTVFGLVESGYEGMRQINVTKNRASNEGLYSLHNQLVSPCATLNRMVLNANSYKSKAQIAAEMIKLLDAGELNTMAEVQSKLRELGYQFSNGEMNQDKFIKFLNDNAEIEHKYETKKALRDAFKQPPILSDNELLEEFNF